MNKKSLKDIAWDVSEDTYRADSALSYSILARYEREGFNNLGKLFDRIDTPSLVFGSAVDSIITGGDTEFKQRFLVAEFPPIADSIVKVVKSIFNNYKESYKSLMEVPDTLIIKETENQSYQLNWKPETRARVIKEKGSRYYYILFTAKDKTILNTQTYTDVCKAVNALKESDSTKRYFADNNPFDNIERYYQLKFKSSYANISYRCMADLLIVDYNKKIVFPVDLKTSSHTEWDFYKSFVDWNYQIQARLYWRIIRDNMNKDSYFKDFDLADYKFIVVNRKTLTPLVWNCSFTQAFGTLKYGKNNQIEFRDPYDIGQELYKYLSTQAKVPNNIYTRSSNDLIAWLKTL